jgi:hypothetical protein
VAEADRLGRYRERMKGSVVTEIILPRRTIIKGLAAMLAAPAIVRIESLMRLPPKPRIIRPAAVAGRFAWGVMGAGQFSDRMTLDGSPILMDTGAPMRAGDIPTGEVVAAVFNGANWVLLP